MPIHRSLSSGSRPCLAACAAIVSATAACSSSPSSAPPTGVSASAVTGSASAAPSAAASATPMWSATFEQDGGVAPGNAHTLTAIVPQLALTRGSAATVQTSPSTVDTTPGVNDARIGSTGAAQGLVVEESRTNYVLWSRDMANWPGNEAGTTVTAAYAAGPDGSESGTRLQVPAGTASGSLVWVATTLGQTLTYSEWLRASAVPVPGGPIVQWGACDNDYNQVATDPPMTTQWTRSILPPLTQGSDQLPAVAATFANPSWCGDTTNTPLLAVDQVVDLVQGELGQFATEPIVATGATATRAGDHLQIVNGAGAVDGGQLSLYLKMYPKGGALAYTAPSYFWYLDANDYALFNPLSQTVTIAVKGVVATSPAPTGTPTALFNAGQTVEWFLRAGSGAGLVELRVNGGTLVTLLNTKTLTGALAPAGSIDLLSSGTTNQFSAWLADVAVYRKGQGGLTSPAPTPPVTLATPYAVSWVGSSFGVNDAPGAYPESSSSGLTDGGAPFTAGPNPAIPPDWLGSIAAGSDGTVYAIGFDSENEHEVEAYKDGNFVATQAGNLLGHFDPTVAASLGVDAFGATAPFDQNECTAELGWTASSAIAANSSYVYSVYLPPSPASFYANGTSQPHWVLSRSYPGQYLNTPATWGAPWVGNPVDRCQGAFFGSTAPYVLGWRGEQWLVDLGPAPATVNLAAAPAVYAAANDTVMAVSNNYTNSIQLLDAQTMTLKACLNVKEPGPVAIDASGNVWVVTSFGDATASPEIVELASTGYGTSSALGSWSGAFGPSSPSLFSWNPGACADAPIAVTAGGQPVQITTPKDPQGLAFDPANGQLLVADHGTQQILSFKIPAGHAPTLAHTFGAANAVTATPGAIVPQALYNVTTVSADASGNIYVGARNPDYIRKYNPQMTQIEWEVDGVGYNNFTAGAFDPATDGQDLYAQNSHYGLDYTKSGGKEWSMKGVTIAPPGTPSQNDPRTTIAYEPIAIRTLGGVKFLFSGSTQAGRELAIFRLTGEEATLVGYVGTDGAAWVPAGYQPIKDDSYGWEAWFWADLNGNGVADPAAEITTLSQLTVCEGPPGLGYWSVDENGDIWLAGADLLDTGGVAPVLWRFPLQTVTTAGVPVYAFTNPVAYPIPPEITWVTKARYIPASDTLYLSGWATSWSRESVAFDQGDTIARYDNVSTHRTLRWVAPLRSTYVADAEDWDVAGNRVFVGATEPTALGNPNLVVLDATTGTLLGGLSPNAATGNAMGALDMTYVVKAYQRADGEYVVTAEDDTYGRIMMFRGTMNF